MQWHAEREKPEDDPEKGKILTHPSDASQWNALDIEFEEFGGDARNVRLGMSTDGLDPFGTRVARIAPGPCLYGNTTSPRGYARSKGMYT